MLARISLITLGVADVAKVMSFYEQLGFVRSKSKPDRGQFFKAGLVVLALFDRDALKDGGEAGDLWTGNCGAIAQNLPSEAAVDAMMARVSRWRGYPGASCQDLLGRL